LPERFIAILNGEFVFALPSKNLRPNVERWPQFRIDAKRRIHIALCTGNIAISQLIACIATQFHHRPLVSAGFDNDWYISAHDGCTR
jgi:hypothetical protein